MVVDGQSLIRCHLDATDDRELRFADGSVTPITPRRCVVRRDEAAFHLDLSGEWLARRWPFPAEEAVLAGPDAPGLDAWERLPQPGKVFYADPHAEGREIPGFDRVGLGHIAEDDGAVLRRSVEIPAAWAGRRVFLRFDGIYPAGRVYLDGQPLGDHLCGLIPVEYEVTGRAIPGRRATVAVRLLRKHRFARMDMVRHALEFGGLSQPACFHAAEPCLLREHNLMTELDVDLRRGRLAGSVVLDGSGSGGEAELELALADPAGRAAGVQRVRVRVDAGSPARAAFSLDVNTPLLWNDEYPNLYTARLTLRLAGQADQHYTWPCGFRRLDLTPEGPRLNGRFIKFRGVNHLTFHPEHGMYTPESWLRQCLRLMKKANVNAIRTHFLGPRCLADLCDELGLYLLQELPIDWGTDYIHDPAWTGPALMRIEGGIARDRHHPSVMVWCIGNENMPRTAAVADDGWNHLRTYHRFSRLLDPHRPTMFPPPGPANKINGIFEVRVGDIADTHYSFGLAREFLATGRLTNPRSWEADPETTTRDEALRGGWSGVWFSSEWGIFNMIPDLLNAPHANAIDDVPEPLFTGRNTLQVFQDRLAREWGLMRGEPTCLGGAYFPWISASAGAGPEGNPWGWMRHGEDADWGVVCADLTPKPFFWALRQAYSPVHIPPRLAWRRGQRDVNFEVHNQFNATDLASCVLRCQFGRAGRWMTMLRKFRDVPVSCPPGERTTVRVPLPDDSWRKALDEGHSILVRLTLLDPRGFKVAVAEIVVVSGAEAKPDDQLMPMGPDAIE
jgi:hypothetical protein